MKIKLSQHLGYCFGVRRAMDLAFQSLARESGPVYSHGPLIHNQPAGRLLTEKGLRLWPGADDSGRATVIVRAHGLPPAALAELAKQPIKVVDATCPRVLWVQKLVNKEALRGKTILIWGSAGHPEVEGLLGYAQGQGLVFEGPDDVAGLPDCREVFLVAQTTQDLALWPEVQAAVLGRWPQAQERNTICQATALRQRETRRLCRVAQSLVVVGGRDSGNTRRLAEIGRQANIPTLAVEGPDEIEPQFLAGGDGTVAVAAGASTPIWQIRAVLQKLQALDRTRGNSPPAFFRRLFRALALSNIYVGLGAGFLGVAVAKWADFKPPGYFFGLYFFYVQAMHLLNGFLDRESARYNDPDRAVFLSQYRRPLVACGVSSLFLSLSAAYQAGPCVLAQLLALSALGLAYALPWPFRLFKVRRLRDLPMSKTISTAGGWAVLLAGPAILADPPLIPRTMAGLSLTAVIAGAIFLNVLARTMIMDLQEVFGDRLFGRKTMASLLGRAKAIRLLAAVLVIWALYLLAALALGGPPTILWLCLTGPLYNAAILMRRWRDLGLMGFQLDLILDAQFVLSGLGYWIL